MSGRNGSPPRNGGLRCPPRYALCELVNLHDQSLEFRPIHRVLFGVKPDDVIFQLLDAFPGAHLGPGEGHALPFVHRDGAGVVTVPHPAFRLPVGTLQSFLDDYVIAHRCRMDYINGADVARELARPTGKSGLPDARPGQKKAVFHHFARWGAAPQDLLHGGGQ